MADPAKALDCYCTLGSFNTCIGAGAIELGHVRQLELDSRQKIEIHKREELLKILPNTPTIRYNLLLGGEKENYAGSR